MPSKKSKKKTPKKASVSRAKSSSAPVDAYEAWLSNQVSLFLDKSKRSSKKS